jgi:hypothetical protein
VPLKYTLHFSPAATVTPVWPEALKVTPYVAVVLSTIYVLLVLGAVIILVVVSVPVILITAYCAVVAPMFVPTASPAVLTKVTAPSPVRVKVPATAIST